MKWILNSILVLILLVISGCAEESKTTNPETKPSAQKELTSLAFKGISSESYYLAKKETTLEFVFKSSTDLRQLTPEIKISDKASISPSDQKDFTRPILYTVTAEDKSTKTYEVRVYNMSDVFKIKLFKSNNPTLDKDYALVDRVTKVNDNQQVATLNPQIEITQGFSFVPKTKFNLENLTRFTITSPLGSIIPVDRQIVSNKTTDPSPEVKPKGTAKITSFKFLAQANQGINVDIDATITYEKEVNSSRLFGRIKATLPHTANLHKLTASASYSQYTQLVGALPTSYSQQVTLQLTNDNGTVTDQDDSSIYYYVNIDKHPAPQPNSSKEITSFKFEKVKNTGLIQDVVYSIDHDNGTLKTTVEHDFDLTKLKTPTLVHNGAKINRPTNPDYQYNGYSFTVFAEDNTYRIYRMETVKKPVPPVQSSAKQITSFRFTRGLNANLKLDYSGKIDHNQKLIQFYLSDQIDLTSLTPIVQLSAKASIPNVVAQNFSTDKQYRVTAEDGTTAIYTVRVNRYKEFITKWQTSKANETISLPISNGIGQSSDYDLTVDWGDNSFTHIDNVNINNNRSHTYSSPGEYTIKLSGKIRGFSFVVNPSSKLLIRDITQWGDVDLGTQEQHFRGAQFLKVSAADIPNLSRVQSLRFSFAEIPDLTIANIDQWNFGQITSMEYMFYASTNFNQPISNISTTKVTNMAFLFAKTNFNSSLTLDTRSVETMRSMFEEAKQFNQPVRFNTHKVTNMDYMFREARAFNQSINFDIGSLVTAVAMFNYAVNMNGTLSFSGVPSRLQNVSFMFAHASKFNQAVHLGETTKLTNTASMFTYASSFNSSLQMRTESVTDMSGMFVGSGFNQPIHFNTANVTNMSSMFMNSPFNQPLPSSFTTAKVTDMQQMFADNTKFNQNVVFDVSKVTNFRSMFFNASNFSSVLNLSHMGQVASSMHTMFYKASKFNQDISNWDVSKVTNMEGMFERATSFNQDISSWDVRKVTKLSDMFHGATQFTHPLSAWKVCLIASKNLVAQSFNFDREAGTTINPQWGVCN